MGRYGPDKDTVERTLDRRIAQQRQLAGARQCPAQQWQLAGSQEQFCAECTHTERSLVVECKALGEHEALFRDEAVKPEQVTRCEVRFVHLAAVDQWRDRDPDGCRRLDRLSRREGR